jgi:hypothetical protein
MSLNWNQRAKKTLLGKQITSVRWMTDEEAKDMGWDNRPLCIELDNSIWIFASMDDEGNNAGTLFTSDEDEPGFPVMSIGDEVK